MIVNATLSLGKNRPRVGEPGSRSCWIAETGMAFGHLIAHDTHPPMS
jgi:hypothetical protein